MSLVPFRALNYLISMKNKRNGNILFYSLIGYVLLAGIWWTYLLYIKNQDAYLARRDLLWLEMQQQNLVDTQNAFFESEAYRMLESQYGQQSWMILGEGSVLFLVLIVGIWVVVNSRQRELAVAEQQQNFLLSITHELKSPIASIKLVLQTLNRRRLSEQQTQKFTQNALNDTERLYSLVQDMLLAARLEDGHRYAFEPTNLELLAQECIERVEPKFQGEIALCNSSPQEKLIAEVEVSTFSSVLINLLENAVKYAPHSPKIEVCLKQQKDQISLEVADQGSGIPKNQRQKIFQKFYRIGSEDTRKTKGTGLGLYIVQKVVEAHKGSVQVLGNQPQGSIFKVSIPRKH